MILFDDFLDEIDMQTIESNLLGIYFPWYYIGKSAYEDNRHGITDYDQYHSTRVMRHKFYDTLSDETISDFLPMCIEPLLKKIMEKTGKNVRLNSALANLLLPNEKYLGTNDIPHTDDRVAGDNAFTALFYVNDADGDTVFYDNKKRISPKRNRFIYWPADGLHSSPGGCSVPRCVINLNFKLE